MAAFAALSIKLLFITLMLVLPFSSTAQSSSNVVDLGSSMVANSANSSWKSPSGEFAFGFRQVSPGGYLLAIWFDQIPEKTLVWSANRDNLAEEGSRIQLFTDGRFELSDPNGQQIWAANFTGSGVAYGAMLDTGNFVLAKNNTNNLWESFDEPTDTLLPTQIFNYGNLVSSFSETNYSGGRFKFSMQIDGDLVLSTRNFPMDNSIKAYTTTMTLGEGFQVIFNQSGYIYLTAQNGTILYNLSSNGISSSQFHQRLILEYDGILRHYIYPKSANSASGRAVAWSVNGFLPSNNICLLIDGDIGAGACGLNSICSLGTDQRPDCTCPPSYTLRDVNDRMSGCIQDFVPQSCNQESNDSELFTFVDIPNLDWYNSHYARFEGVEEDFCRQMCLNDCFCAVIIIKDDECWLKKIPLPNGRTSPAFQLKALVKIRKGGNATVWPGGGGSSKSNQSVVIITGSVLLGSSVFLNLLLFSSVLFFFIPRLNGRKSRLAPQDAVVPSVNMRRFSFDELKEATNEFEEELGCGACSTVYKGVLRDEDGRVVAVKKLDKIPKEAEKEFKAEVSSISKTNHKNLVKLLGYCEEGQNRLLVYEFMINGSLADFLFGISKPDWYTRIQIAFAIARGLRYLHDECSTQIIHCDIKPQNVLLDESHVAKISDFGLAKLLRSEETRTTTGIRGTRGYVAPEWFRNMPITAKVDVYSFGILLFELICCRKKVDHNVVDEREAILVDWACDCYREGTLCSLVANDKEAIDDLKSFEKFVMIAIWCVQEDPELRPNMKEVMHMLEGSTEVPLPPHFESFIN